MTQTTTFDFTDSVAVVTGAAGALGEAVSRRFLDAGAHVAGIDIDHPEWADLDNHGDRFRFYECDLTDEPAVEQTIDDIAGEFGQIDALANIAGTWRGGRPVHETDNATFDLLMNINVRTMFLASKHAIPHLRETDGAIVSVASRSSLRGGEGDALYRASKASIRILTESIAEEQRGTVRANAVLPSVLDTPMNREMMTPNDEWVDPSEVASVILFLCSDAASVTSGAAVPVYGEA